MPRQKDSIASRLSIVVMVAILAGVLASVSFFLIGEFQRSFLAEKARFQSSLAAFAAAAGPSVRTLDEYSVLQVLRGIRAIPEIQYVAVRDRSRRILAEIGGSTVLQARNTSAHDAGVLTMLQADTLEVSSSILDGGEVVGSIELTAGIAELRGRYWNAFLMAVMFASVVIVVTATVARAQIARIVRPLARLADEFLDIGQRSDLTHRLENQTSDEVGVLVDAFNHMFVQIDQRDRMLSQHRDTLEATVVERTSQLTSAKLEAEAANRAKSDFLATMSHEIRTPMNGMMVMAEMLSAAPLSPKHRRFAQIITRSGRNLLTIVNDLLDFSKIEAGKMDLESVEFSLDTIVEDCASLFAERANEKGLALTLTLAPDLPLRVIGDPTRLSQIIGNLVNNGLKFTEQGGVSIELASSIDEDSRCVVEVHVRDTGIGIEAGKVDLIFERFSQADSSITRKFGGTGLGLSICQRLVEAMGGQLAVESVVGSGSDFHFAIEMDVAKSASQDFDLDGVKVSVLARSAIVRRSVELNLSGWRASIVDPHEGPDLVVQEPGLTAPIRLGTPKVLLRAFGSSDAASEAGAIDVVGSIGMPLSRREIVGLAEAIAKRDWSILQTSQSNENSTPAATDLRKLRVLAVDDTAVNREVLSEALKSLGIAPVIAESGPDAVEWCQRRAFDVVFMDCSMPGMDGFAATAAIRALEAERGDGRSFIVALTAHISGPEAERWSTAGMDAYVPKPFTIESITSVLQSVASKQRQVTNMPANGDAVTEIADAEILSSARLKMFAAISGSQDSAMVEKVFRLFENQAKAALDNLRRLATAPMAERAAQAHALKSMCLSAGADRAALAAGWIEQQFQAGTAPSADDVWQLETAVSETIAAMKRYLADAGSRSDRSNTPPVIISV